jgi:uncharacterized protein YjbI with pentapeptide repeats
MATFTREEIEAKIQTEGSGLSLAGKDLSGLDLSNLELSGTNFAGTNLSGANLKKAQVRRVDLTGANVERANLSGANLSEAIFTGAKLDGVNLSGAYLLKANLAGVNLSGANLAKTKLDEVVFNGANLSRANLDRAFAVRANLSQVNLSQADLPKLNLKNADLSGANLNGANLSGAFLEGAKLNGADLRQANLKEATFKLAVYDDQTQWDAGFDPVVAGAITKKKKWWRYFQKLSRFHLLLCTLVMLSACRSGPDVTPTPIPTPTRESIVPYNENVEALNAAQAALQEQDFGFAPLLLDAEARVVLETVAGSELARLAYPRQPADPADWPTVDSFVSTYAVRRFMMNLPQVTRVALGHLKVPASIGNAAEDVEHIAAWITFLDGSRAIIDLTPLATNFASRHIPDRMMFESSEIASIFDNRRRGVNLDRLQPMTVVEQEGELYYLLAKVLVSFDRYSFALHIHPVEPADPITPLNIRPGATAGIQINRDEFEALKALVTDLGPTAFNDQPQLLTRRGSIDQALMAALDENLNLLWHLITKFEHQLPDPTIPTSTPTVTPTPSPTPTPTPTPTPQKLPLLTS